MAENAPFRNEEAQTPSLRLKKKPQHIPKALRPCTFIVDCSINLFINKVFSRLPASLQQHALQHIRISNMPNSLRRPHIQPDSQLRPRLRPFHHPQKAALIPPQRRRHRRHLSEHLRARKSQIQRDQSAQGRPTQSGILRIRQRSVRAVNQRLQLLNQQPPIASSLSAPHLRVARGRVLRHPPKSRIRHPDQDYRLNLPVQSQLISRRMRLPRSSRNVRRSPIEQILPIVQIQNREASLLILQILRRKIHRNSSVVRQNLRMKISDAVSRIRIQFVWGMLCNRLLGQTDGRGFALKNFKCRDGMSWR